jgi:hypothetical protein
MLRFVGSCSGMETTINSRLLFASSLFDATLRLSPSPAATLASLNTAARSLYASGTRRTCQRSRSSTQGGLQLVSQFLGSMFIHTLLIDRLWPVGRLEPREGISAEPPAGPCSRLARGGLAGPGGKPGIDQLVGCVRGLDGAVAQWRSPRTTILSGLSLLGPASSQSGSSEPPLGEAAGAAEFLMAFLPMSTG